MTRTTWFDSLTIPEASRINRAFREKGYSFNAWENCQDELEAAYVELPTQKWADRTDHYFTEEADLDAWKSWCATADRTGLIHYPTMTEVEKNCVALVGGLVAVEKNSGSFRRESLITALPKEPVLNENIEEAHKETHKETFKGKVERYLFG